MPDNIRKPSYCPNCVKNVPHYRRANSFFGVVVDPLMGKLLARLRLGPWFCLHCERQQWFLTAPRKNADDYKILNLDAVQLDTDSHWIRAPATPQSDAQKQESSEIDLPVGNFIKAESSLVLRSNRLSSHSEKFRDSILDRLAHGQISMSRIRREYELTEAELQDWIADRLLRLGRENDRLRQEAESDVPTLEIVPKSSETSKPK